jgi:RHS repeat-associated protein
MTGLLRQLLALILSGLLPVSASTETKCSVTYPNGVAHNYSYDTRNRLTNLGVNGTVSGTPGAIASYAYTLDAAGHRLSVSELSGRTVNYGYDNLYRLTGETIAGDPNGINGAVNYSYDAVGNRKQITSTLAPVPAGLWNYDANDRFTAGDTYDADGNTVSSGGIANVYDFENHLIQKAGVTIVYDGDGNRVSKTVAGVTTTYLVDTLNPTGYAQVVYETFSGSSSGNRELNHSYVYGLEQISQTRSYVANFQSATQKIYYAYDGHGSVRALTDPTGAITDTYDYDAFGNLIHSTGTTPNNYLFAGEQFDPDLNLYYNRARYFNTASDRFWTADVADPDLFEPLSLHRYLYANGDPVNRADPTGEQATLAEAAGELLTIMVVATLVTLVAQQALRNVKAEVSLRLNHYTRWVNRCGRATPANSRQMASRCRQSQQVLRAAEWRAARSVWLSMLKTTLGSPTTAVGP